MTQSKRLPPAKRIKKSSEFRRLHDRGRKLHTKHFLILVEPSASGVSRIGITVTTKIDKRAVVRNKLKRRIREVFRLNNARLKAPLDISVIARRESPDCDVEQIKREIMGALYHNGYLQGGAPQQNTSRQNSK